MTGISTGGSNNYRPGGSRGGYDPYGRGGGGSGGGTRKNIGGFGSSGCKNF